VNIQALLRSNRQRRFRKQHGTVVQRADAFYLRYYIDDADGNRRKVTDKLCGLDSAKPAIENARRKRMKAINAEAHQERTAPVTDLAIGDFWKTYLEDAKKELRWSTVHGYEKLWSQYLEEELASLSLTPYRTADGYHFLSKLNSKLNRNSLAHVRSLASGIFSYAVNLGLIDRNPWSEVKSPKARAPRPKVAYTVTEIKTILAAIETIQGKLFFALCAILGMRPSEAAGVRWENVLETELQVKQAVVKGHPDQLKTHQSEGSLPLIEPVKSLMTAWRAECGEPTSGWLFTRPNGQPIEHSNFVKKYISPYAKPVCPRWCGPYSGRHGAATVLFDLTGDARAANQVLRNSLPVVMKNYIKPSTAAGEAGLKLYEQALGEATVESSK
jgi:integrase